MIKSIRVVNPSEEFLDLDLETSHIETGIYIKQITGIGPEKASINTTALAMEDGGVFNSARANVRNIVLTLGFYESPTLHNSIEDSRHLTYKFFPKKKQITLEFYTDNRDSFITGYVESNEPDIFSKEESTQISVICPDPNFYSVADNTRKFAGINAEFEFPFSNETVEIPAAYVGGIDNTIVSFSDVEPPQFIGSSGDVCYCRTTNVHLFNEYIYNGLKWISTAYNKRVYQPDLLIADINENGLTQIIYEGDADVGVTLTVHFLKRATNILIKQPNTGSQITIDTAKIETIMNTTIMSGDDIVLNTRPGSKTMYFMRNGDSTTIINAIDREEFEECWFKLEKGVNQFTFSAESGFDDVQIFINSNIAYDGV